MNESTPAQESSTTRSPAPWRRGNLGYIYAPDGKRETLVARVGAFTDKELLPHCRERWTADANLIAAAPSTLHELKAAASWLRVLIPYLEEISGEMTRMTPLLTNTEQQLKSMDAAIARAEGRAS